MTQRVGQGGTITLNAIYRDGYGTPVDPTTPLLDILDPDAAVVVSGLVPIRDGVGAYHRAYTVASDADLGLWTARWSGVINSLLRHGSEPFEVTVAGVASSGELYPEAEGPIRAWVRSLGLCDGRAFFGPPKKPRYPLIVLFQVGGAPLHGGAPIANPTIQFDVWGATERDRLLVKGIATQLESEIEHLRAGTELRTDAVALGAEVTSSAQWLPDPETGQARYTLDASFLLRVNVAA